MALKVGQYLITVPVVMIIIGILGVIWYLVAWGSVHWVFGPLGFILAPAFGWLYWSLTITYWRLWAFRRVACCRELKELAIDIGLIWDDHSLMSRSEIRSSRQHTILKNFECSDSKTTPKKYRFKDQFEVIQKEFKYDKSRLILGLIQYLTIIVVGVILMMLLNNLLPGVVMSIIGMVFTFSICQKIMFDTAPLVVNRKGISIDDELLEWDLISNETARVDGPENKRNAYLFYEIDGVTLWLNLSDYDIIISDFKKTLKSFRNLHTMSHQHRNADPSLLPARQEESLF